MSEKVNEPKYIRDGWTNFLEGMLYNIQGLPASSFRTDN
jgi:sialate O-acetylesterase